VFPDVFTKRELNGLYLHCTNQGCPWHGTYEAVEVSCGGKKERGNLVPRASDPREETRWSGIILFRKPGILANIELRIPYQRPIRFLPETDYPRASRSFPRIAGSGERDWERGGTKVKII
jgi:hypothetical protein